MELLPWVLVAVVILLLTLAVWVAYYLDLGIFDKIKNFFYGARIAIATVISIWLIAIVLLAIFGEA